MLNRLKACALIIINIEIGIDRKGKDPGPLKSALSESLWYKPILKCS